MTPDDRAVLAAILLAFALFVAIAALPTPF